MQKNIFICNNKKYLWINLNRLFIKIEILKKNKILKICIRIKKKNVYGITYGN